MHRHRDRGERGRKNAAESSQNGARAQRVARGRRERAAARRRRGRGRGARRSTSACSGIVIGAEHRGEDHERVAPAVRVDQRLGQRQEDEARQRGDERHRGHRAPALGGVGELLGQHGERRLVEDDRHHEPERDPQRVERGEARRPATTRARARRRRSSRAVISAARAVAVEVAADGDAGDAGDEQARARTRRSAARPRSRARAASGPGRPRRRSRGSPTRRSR